jgi:prophage regulatory protein
MRAPDVTRITGLSRTSIYRMECAGRFPQRVQLSSNSVAWRKADVVEWINSRPNGRPLRIDQL